MIETIEIAVASFILGAVLATTVFFLISGLGTKYLFGELTINTDQIDADLFKLNIVNDDINELVKAKKVILMVKHVGKDGLK